MPEHITPPAPNVGDTLIADQIPALPVGTVVRDQSDTYVRQENPGSWFSDGGIRQWWTGELQGLASSEDYGPIVLVALPDGSGQPDLFQQARLALRDRFGVEPSPADIAAVSLAMKQQGVSAAEAVTGLRAVKTAPEPEPAPTFLIVLVEGADASTQFVVADDTTAGLARLRAHAALDALLDQHGISR